MDFLLVSVFTRGLHFLWDESDSTVELKE